MIEAKRERMKATFIAYMDGNGLPTIARELGLSKSTVSLHLNGAKSRDDQLREIVAGMTPKTLARDKGRLLELLKKGG